MPDLKSQPEARRSVRALLANLIDYAGLFPPARLDMAETVANYANYLHSDDAWMLGRIIVPVSRLDEFEEHATHHLPKGAEDEPWLLSCLTAQAGDDQLDTDLERIAQFNDKHADAAVGRAVIDVIELRATDAGSIDASLDAVPDELFPFFELPVAEDPRGLIAALVGSDAGAKIRTGGIEPHLHPAPPDVARFITACAGAGVAFKATAGLHHPLRHYAESVGAKQYGFLNVFTAAVIARHVELPEADLLGVLEEAEPDAFTFDDDGLAWRDIRLGTEQIEDARLDFAIGFGSCSFDEPRDDLRSLKILPPENAP